MYHTREILTGITTDFKGLLENKMESFQGNGIPSILQLASLHYAAMETLQKNSAGHLIYFYLKWIEHMTFAFKTMSVLWCAASYYHTSPRWLLMWYLTGYGYLLEGVTRCLMIRAVFSRGGEGARHDIHHHF